MSSNIKKNSINILQKSINYALEQFIVVVVEVIDDVVITSNDLACYTKAKLDKNTWYGDFGASHQMMNIYHWFRNLQTIFQGRFKVHVTDDATIWVIIIRDIPIQNHVNNEWKDGIQSFLYVPKLKKNIFLCGIND